MCYAETFAYSEKLKDNNYREGHALLSDIHPILASIT